MIDAREEIHPPRRAWIAAVWCAGALGDASQTMVTMHAVGGGRPWLLPFAIEFVSWLPWALASPPIIRLARRWPIIGGEIWKALPVHLAAYTVVSAVTEAWSALLHVAFNPWRRTPPPDFASTWTTLLSYQFLTFIIAYALILTVTYVVDVREKMTRQKTEAARLNEQLSQAKFSALRRQMDPHFMFNTLNSITGLVRDRRNDQAVNMIVGLSEFLRRASEDSSRAQVTLAEEVEYLDRYLDIQKIRYGDRLQVSLDIPADLLHALVPSLLLQPLVENAIKHGVSKRIAGGEIRVVAARRDGALCLTVYNDGPWIPEGANTGVGLSNLRTRLEILHGARSDLAVRPVELGGVEVVATLPLRET